MTLDQLENKVTRNPLSPLFARLAEEHLRVGKTDSAKQHVLTGLIHHPDYPTAHLIAARSHATAHEYSDALQHLNHAFTYLPGNPGLLKMRTDWESAIEELAVLPKPQEFQQKVQETPLEDLAQKLETSPRITPQEGLVTSPPAVAREDSGEIEEGIISVTLAEIYATQGAYEAAIAMYKKLRQQRPQQADQFDKKIRELERKVKS